MFIASQVSARDFYKGEMSKLTTQQALPRRKLFRIGGVVNGTGIAINAPKPKRKAKKAKGKR